MMLALLFALGLSALAEPGAIPASGRVASVYDGDTLTLESGDKIRLRWANAPEIKPPEAYSVEAREAAKSLVLGQEVTLSPTADGRDGYGRIVAGLKAPGGDLSLMLLEQGLAHLFVIPPDDTDLSEMLAAQKRARDARLGIWSTDRYSGELHITSFHANAAGDDRANVNGEYLRVSNITTEPLQIAGYRIVDNLGGSWTFPDLVVPAGHTFLVKSGEGRHQTDPRAQLVVQLGSPYPIWDNTRAHATLYDRFGRVQDSREHVAKGPASP